MYSVGEISEEAFERALPHLHELITEWLRHEIEAGRLVKVQANGAEVIKLPNKLKGGDEIAQTLPATVSPDETIAHPPRYAAEAAEAGEAELARTTPADSGRRQGVS